MSEKYSYCPVFFLLSTQKSFEAFPKINGTAFFKNLLL